MSNDQWYTRPVFFVPNVEELLTFYCDKLGFEKIWDYYANDQMLVAQVNRGTKCQIILSQDERRSGNGRVFIELLPDEMATLEKEIKAKQILANNTSWGMPIVQITDPCGNELFFTTD